MKNIRYLSLLIVIALVGFALGRLTGIGGGSEVPRTNTAHPLPPPPPESTPYVPGDFVVDDEDVQRVVIETPVDGASATGAFSVTGRAIVTADEALMVTVATDDGDVLHEGAVGVTHDEGARYGRFDLAVGPFDVEEPVDAVVRVFFRDVEGEESDVQERDVTLSPRDERVSVEVYFQNSELDPSVSCEIVFPVMREVSVGTQVYRAAVTALLEGPTDEEEEEGYNTSIPSRVRLLSVTADDDGTVTADFDGRLDAGVAGSCRVGAIREQISKTLLQFPEVRDVVISVEGEVDEALQP